MGIIVSIMYYYYYFFIFQKWGAKDTYNTQSVEKCVYARVCVCKYIIVYAVEFSIHRAIWDCHVLHKISAICLYFHTESYLNDTKAYCCSNVFSDTWLRFRLQQQFWISLTHFPHIYYTYYIFNGPLSFGIQLALNK